jgi:hypothetical protein
MKNRQWMIDYGKIKKSLEDREQDSISSAGRCALDALMTTDNETKARCEVEARAYHAKATAFHAALNDVSFHKELIELAEPDEPKSNP